MPSFSVCLFLCLPVPLSACPYVCLSLCLSSFSVCLSLCLSILVGLLALAALQQHFVLWPINVVALFVVIVVGAGLEDMLCISHGQKMVAKQFAIKLQQQQQMAADVLVAEANTKQPTMRNESQSCPATEWLPPSLLFSSPSSPSPAELCELWTLAPFCWPTESVA